MLVLVLCGQLPGARAGERYELHWRTRTYATPEFVTKTETEWIVWLRDNQRGKTLWTRHLDYHFDPAKDVFWSKDRKALVVSHIWNFYVWREGYRLRCFGAPDDYMMGFAWSPDNRRLLARSDGSGAVDVDRGGLYCLELGAWPRYKYFHLDVAGEFGWMNPTKVAYAPDEAFHFVLGESLQKVGPPVRVVWRVPRSSMSHRANRRD